VFIKTTPQETGAQANTNANSKSTQVLLPQNSPDLDITANFISLHKDLEE